ncbi:hypothetical protein [Mycobacterium sp. D16Q16]|nr:hypothetical protein [Mycobacterium sp. D16Q16]
MGNADPIFTDSSTALATFLRSEAPVGCRGALESRNQSLWAELIES